MKYIVYTRLAKLSGEAIEVCVVGVEAHSAGGAEHRLLDSFQTVTNALAFDMDSEMQFANPYMAASRCMSFAEFAERMNHREKAMQRVIDEQLEEVEYVQGENFRIRSEIYALKRKMETLEAQIADNRGYITELEKELDDFCKKLNMRPKRSEEISCQGIA